MDFVLERKCELVALEVKTTGQALRSDAAGIEAFRASLRKPARLRRGVVLYGGEPRVLAEGVLALPLGWLVPA